MHEVSVHNLSIDPRPRQDRGSLFTSERTVIDSRYFESMPPSKIGKPYGLSAPKFNNSPAILLF
jgi:hypothetical protein